MRVSISMDRRRFLQLTGTAAAGAGIVFSAGEQNLFAQTQNENNKNKKEISAMNIVVAADPFAVTLKDAVVAHLKEKGYKVTDVGATTDKEIPYYEGVVPACKMLQEKKADRALLFCGTGMGMSVIANRFPGVIASCVESVFATEMCRTINDANALCMGAMIWGEWMAKTAVDVFLETPFAEGLPDLADFLRDAAKKVEKIQP